MKWNRNIEDGEEIKIKKIMNKSGEREKERGGGVRKGEK